MSEIRKKLQRRNTDIVCDANVYLHIYAFSPEYSEYAVKCLNSVKEFLVMPSMIEIEYNNHRVVEFKRMGKRITEAKNNCLRQLQKARSSCLSIGTNLEKLGFQETDELFVAIDQKYENMIREVEDYFADRDATMGLLANSWGSRDRVYDIYEFVRKNGAVLEPFTQLDLYRLCENGQKRFKKEQPPGYKDKDKDGLSKYGDLIWWKEVLRYAKKRKRNIILVTDDIKEDWWESKDDGTVGLREELFQEFSRTGQQLFAYTSTSFYDAIAEDYCIHVPDMVQCALGLTDDAYCERIADKVFDEIRDELEINGMDYIDEESAHIEALGIDSLDIESYEYVKGEQANRENEEVYYLLDYNVTLSGRSHDYWGKDDETKEILISPGTYHEFRGTIQVAIKRQADIFVDFENEDGFEGAEIVDGKLYESYYKSWADEEDEYSEETFDMLNMR